jgi:hypothetical protein
VTCALAVSVIVAGSTGCAQDARGNGPYASEVADAIPRVERAVGLKFKTPPRFESRTKDEVRAFLEKEFATSHAARDLAGTETAYKLLGMIPDTMNLRAEMERLLVEQIVGFYDPKTKVLYIVDGAPPAEVGIVVTHELVHALQDQYINLDSLQNLEGDDDRQAAAQAVIEGQAVFDQLAAMAGNRNFVGMIPGGWDAMRQQIRQGQSSMPAFAAAPMVLQETLIFPYLSGAEFIHNFDVRQPGKQPFNDMPASTSQILHSTEDYFDHRVQPVRVTLPPVPSGAHVDYDNNLGEFETRLELYQVLDDQAAAIRGATGWAGDRYEVMSVGHGPALASKAIVWVTLWRSPVEAAQFRDLLQQVVAKRAKTHTQRAITITPVQIGDYPAVAYEDKPSSVSSKLIDAAKVQIH